jgi:MATE family multidrug resistance protein
VNTYTRLISLATPVTLMGLLDKIANVFAVLFLARLGTQEMAANLLAFYCLITVLTIAVTSLYSVSILTSHAAGNGNDKHIGSIFRHALLVAALVGFPCSFLLWHAGFALKVFHQDPQLIELTVPYFHAVAISLIPTQFSNVIAQFYIGISRPRIALIRTVVATPLLIIFSYVFILGKFNFPQMGLAGIGIAILIVRSFSFLFLLTYLFIDRSINKFQLFDFTQGICLTTCKKIFTLGMPIGLQFGGELAAMTVATFFLGHFGATALAAGQIVSQYVVLVIMVILGISQATSVLISEAYAKKDGALIREYKTASMTLLTYLFIVIIGLFSFAPTLLMQPYININDLHHKELVHLTYVFFVIAGVTMYIDAIRNVLSACLRGLHQSCYPMIVGVICLWGISLPASYIAGYSLGGGAIGLRIAFTFGFLVAVGILWKVFNRRIQLLNQPGSAPLN